MKNESEYNKLKLKNDELEYKFKNLAKEKQNKQNN